MSDKVYSDLGRVKYKFNFNKLELEVLFYPLSVLNTLPNQIIHITVSMQFQKV
jgi:hypothetical protein